MSKKYFKGEFCGWQRTFNLVFQIVWVCNCGDINFVEQIGRFSRI